MKIQVDIKPETSKALEVHKLRYNLYDKREALVDALERFFENDDFDYFLEENLKKRKEQPKKSKDNFEKHLDEKDKNKKARKVLK